MLDFKFGNTGIQVNVYLVYMYKSCVINIVKCEVQ